MRSTLALAGLLALLLGAGSSSSAATAKPANYDAFGMGLLRRLTGAQPSTNVFISPVSIGVALAMAADGAAGSTRSGMLQTLGLTTDVAGANQELIAALHANGDAKIGLANAIWLRSDIPPSPSYVSLLAKNYGAQAQAVDFASPQTAETINAWVKTNTLGLIDHLIDRTSPTDFAYLTNALAFQAKWSQPFKADGTHPHPFTNADGTSVTVSMMQQVANFSTANGDGYDMVRMPYGNGGFAAYVLLPKTNSAVALLQHLTAATFDQNVKTLKSEHIALSLPRFTIAYHVGLIPELKAMGMSAAFSDAANFSAMHAPPPQLRISSVEHATYLRVDEDGTTAAAATSVGMSLMAMRVEKPPRPIVVDHPFVFALRDERSGTLLFIGAIRKLDDASK
ncbi:MAG TPA: serpin family protein [Candidatus Acidoferrales bacterium]|jgi:serine protease inhibitor|nr:serpin family protein [Candidatus Acidoferrales bacterium]